MSEQSQSSEPAGCEELQSETTGEAEAAIVMSAFAECFKTIALSHDPDAKAALRDHMFLYVAEPGVYPDTLSEVLQLDVSLPPSSGQTSAVEHFQRVCRHSFQIMNAGDYGAPAICQVCTKSIPRKSKFRECDRCELLLCHHCRY